MKRVEAIIEPFKLNDVERALAQTGAIGMSVNDVRGVGQRKGRSEIFRGTECVVDFPPKIRIEVAVPDGQVEKIALALTEAAHTGRLGDGKVFITPIEDSVRIRTGERGDAALS